MKGKHGPEPINADPDLPTGQANNNHTCPVPTVARARRQCGQPCRQARDCCCYYPVHISAEETRAERPEAGTAEQSSRCGTWNCSPDGAPQGGKHGPPPGPSRITTGLSPCSHSLQASSWGFTARLWACAPGTGRPVKAGQGWRLSRPSGTWIDTVGPAVATCCPPPPAPILQRSGLVFSTEWMILAQMPLRAGSTSTVPKVKLEMHAARRSYLGAGGSGLPGTLLLPTSSADEQTRR